MQTDGRRKKQIELAFWPIRSRVERQFMWITARVHWAYYNNMHTVHCKLGHWECEIMTVIITGVRQDGGSMQFVPLLISFGDALESNNASGGYNLVSTLTWWSLSDWKALFWSHLDHLNCNDSQLEHKFGSPNRFGLRSGPLLVAYICDYKMLF